MDTRKRKVINAIKKADSSDDDWCYQILYYVDELYARGYLSAKIDNYNSNGGEFNEEFKEEFIEWVTLVNYG